MAAYVRVSTDDDDQLGSFESQKLYYEEKIGENPEWVNAGIFADEAITGTKTDKRTGFQEMINRCLNGEIDLILTKSISRFARNEKPVWQCMNATKNGIKNCPHCKAIDEAILEGAFLEAFGLLAGNFDDVLDIVMSNVEEALNNAEDVRKKQQLDKDISSLESKKSRMTDMLIDGTISKEVYDEKVLEFTRKLHTLSERRYLLEESINKQKDVGKRMSALRETLISEQVLDEFDRVVFESIIEKVLVGGFDEEGNPDPYKLTFVLKGNQSGTVPNAKEHYKAIQKELKKGNKVS